MVPYFHSGSHMASIIMHRAEFEPARMCAQVIPNNRKYGLPLNETLLPQHLKALGYHTHGAHARVSTCAYAPARLACAPCTVRDSACDGNPLRFALA